MVSALIESGLPTFHILITDTVPTNRERLKEIVAHARKSDEEAAIEEVVLEKGAGLNGRRSCGHSTRYYMCHRRVILRN